MSPIVFVSGVEQVAFFLLLWVGREELGPAKIQALLFLWAAALTGSFLVPWGGPLFIALVAIIDVALILYVFEGDLPAR